MEFPNYFVVGLQVNEEGRKVGDAIVEQHKSLEYATKATSRLRFDFNCNRTYVYGGVRMVWDKESESYVVRESE